jgi:hypothetical protein
MDHSWSISALPQKRTPISAFWTAVKGHVWTAPAVQEESDPSAKRSGAAMYSACFRVEACPFAMQPLWLLALM